MYKIFMISTRIILFLLAVYATIKAYYAAEHRHTSKTIIWCTMILVCAEGLASWT